jgi:Tfp pilus assembly PilM family ATPase
VQSNSLNLVALVSDGKSLHLAGADHRMLPAGVIEQGHWRNRELMCEVLRQGCAALGASVQAVALSIATDAVITSELLLSRRAFVHQHCAEVSHAVKRLTPWTHSNTAADWWSYGDGRALLAMCRVDTIDTARRCLLEVGLQLRHVEPECQSHWRLLDRLQREQSTEQAVLMLVNVQPDLLSMSVFCAGALHFSQSVKPEYRRDAALRERFVLEAVQEALRQAELDTIADGFIAVTGVLADESLCAVLGSAFAISVTLISPLMSTLGITKDPRLGCEDSEPCLGVAVGCALWGFND